MSARDVFAIAMNTYREAVRARVLFGLLAAALAASAYSLVIAAMSIRQEMRIVADIGAASISAFAVLVAIILGATSLYRELELKTIFPILTRQPPPPRVRRRQVPRDPRRRSLAFVAIDGASVLAHHGRSSRAERRPHARRGRRLLARPRHRAVAREAHACLPRPAVGARRVRRRWRSLAQAPAESGSSSSSRPADARRGRDRHGDRDAVLLVLVAVPDRDLHSRWCSSSGARPTRSATSRRGSSAARSAPSGIVLARVFPNLNLYVPARPVLLGQVAGGLAVGATSSARGATPSSTRSVLLVAERARVPEARLPVTRACARAASPRSLAVVVLGDCLGRRVRAEGGGARESDAALARGDASDAILRGAQAAEARCPRAAPRRATRGSSGSRATPRRAATTPPRSPPGARLAPRSLATSIVDARPPRGVRTPRSEIRGALAHRIDAAAAAAGAGRRPPPPRTASGPRSPRATIPGGGDVRAPSASAASCSSWRVHASRGARTERSMTDLGLAALGIGVAAAGALLF